MRMFFYAAAMLAMAAAVPARADWIEARTNHFIIYIDGSEAAARDFATRLERFDAALRRLYDVPDRPEQHVNPVRVFALKDDLFYQTCGGCYGALGYYLARVGGSVIYTAHMPGADKKAQPGSWSSQTVLLHEYGHHFMFSNYPLAYPYWFTEGFAEFNANVTFNDDSSVTLGLPANYRAEAIRSGGSLTAKQFFDPQSYGFGSRIDLLYGRGWLFTHYLVLNPRRKGQLAVYLSEMNRGRSSLQAATAAFGDVQKVYDELLAYGKNPLSPPLRIPPPEKPIEVKVTPLPPGQAEMFPIHAASVRGVSENVALGIAIRARKVASRFPEDVVVQSELAEAELDAGKLDRADAAADLALARRPDLVQALIFKGMVAVRRATEAKVTDPTVWTAARAWFLKANRADPNASMPLYLYYQSFRAAKTAPSAGAIRGLSRAQVLSPESSAVRVALARQMLEDGDAASARFLLQPIAFEPHRRSAENVARAVIVLIDSGKLPEAKAAMDGDKNDSKED